MSDVIAGRERLDIISRWHLDTAHKESAAAPLYDRDKGLIHRPSVSRLSIQRGPIDPSFGSSGKLTSG